MTGKTCRLYTGCNLLLPKTTTELLSAKRVYINCVNGKCYKYIFHFHKGKSAKSKAFLRILTL